MHFATTAALCSLATLVAGTVIPQFNTSSHITTRGSPEDGNLWEVYFYEAGCTDDADGSVNVVSSYGPVGCEGGPSPGAQFRSIKVVSGGYKFNLHQNEVCSEPIDTVTSDGCYTAPADHFIVSFNVEEK